MKWQNDSKEVVDSTVYILLLLSTALLSGILCQLPKVGQTLQLNWPTHQFEYKLLKNSNHDKINIIQ
ncbi:hypothetical protein APC42_07350 [Acinetobacter pittii]|nr:hypothetical protein APC42_07350 [Acinetobacter pittii]